MICFKSKEKYEKMIKENFVNLSFKTDFESIIVDLGAGKVIEQSSELSKNIGNLFYRSPESKHSDENDGFAFKTSDIFSAGVILLTTFYEIPNYMFMNCKTFYENFENWIEETIEQGFDKGDYPAL